MSATIDIHTHIEVGLLSRI